MKKEMTKLIIVTILLVLVIAGSISGTVLSQAKGKPSVDNKHYQQLEREYLASVKGILTDEGFRNSGVTITKIIEEDGSRQYQVLIHHGKLDRLSEQEKETLTLQLAQIDFPVEDCSFFHEFLENDL